VREDYTFLKKSKKTLLMFRRMSKVDGENGHAKLELRHQRTGDVVFDWKGKYLPNSLFYYRSYQPFLKATVLYVQAYRDSPSQSHDRPQEVALFKDD
jgi:hypothetical protein